MTETKRVPQRGDVVFVPDGYGTWVNGVVNNVDAKPDGVLLVGVVKSAHVSGARLIRASVEEYLSEWAWPEDMPAMRSPNEN